MNTRTRIYVDGQEGTTGLRIHQLLQDRDDLSLLTIEPERRKDPAARAACLQAADVAFLCLPDEAAREAHRLAGDAPVCLIDASTAHRVDPDWVYGLPELHRGQRDRIRGARRISNPGCHATAFILLVRPLIDAGLLDPRAALQAQSLTGYTGGGKAMIADYEAALKQPQSAWWAPRPYALGLKHKHLPEMQAHTGLHQAPCFVPVVGPWDQGLQLSLCVPEQGPQGRVTGEQIHAAWSTHYAGEVFVQVRPLNDPAVLQAQSLDITACKGTNRVDLHVFAQGPHLWLSARLDNLGKGASGAAVQCMNLVLGWPEGLGLTA